MAQAPAAHSLPRFAQALIAAPARRGAAPPPDLLRRPALHLLHRRTALQERIFSEAEASGAEYVRVDVELHGIFGAAGTATGPTGATSTA